MVAGPECLRGGDSETAGHAPREPHEQEQQPAGGSYCGERVDTKMLAHHYGVNNLVHLLDNVPDEQGDCEHDDDSPRCARGEGRGHVKTPG